MQEKRNFVGIMENRLREFGNGPIECIYRNNVLPTKMGVLNEKMCKMKGLNYLLVLVILYFTPIRFLNDLIPDFFTEPLPL